MSDDERDLDTDVGVPGMQEDAEGDVPTGDSLGVGRADGYVSSGTTQSSGASEEDQSDQGVEEALIPILWHSNAPWVGTGYGAQSGLFGPLIAQQLGYDVGFSSWFGLRGRKIGWTAPHTGTSHIVYPAGRDLHGNDVVRANTTHYFRGRVGLVVFLSDPWIMPYKLAAALPLLSWCPVDHDPLIPQTDAWLKKGGAKIVAMSQFGKRVFEEAGFTEVQYVPHGVDTNVFKPAERAEARKALGLPQDAFIVGMVAANVGLKGAGRKSFSEALQAFAIFQQKHPDALLYLHTLVETDGGDSLVRMADALKIRFVNIDQYAYILGCPEDLVAATYNSFDVLLNPARGEGFGLPILEAQACGTPTIVTNFSAMPEVAPKEVGNWHVEGQRIWSQFDSFQVIPFVDNIVNALEEAYDEPAGLRVARRVSTYQHAQKYDSVKITNEYWQPVLSWAMNEIAWRRMHPQR